MRQISLAIRKLTTKSALQAAAKADAEYIKDECDAGRTVQVVGRYGIFGAIIAETGVAIQASSEAMHDNSSYVPGDVPRN